MNSPIFPNPMFNKVWINVVSWAVIGTLGFLMGYISSSKRYEQKVDAAAHEYTKFIGGLVDEAVLVSKKQDTKKLYVSAAAIVATRNDLRGSLLSLSKLLNSEIDLLEKLVNLPDPGDGVKHREITKIVEILGKKWPSKKKQIAVELRKLLSVIGLEPIN